MATNLITACGAAALLGIGTADVDRLVRKGLIPTVELPGGLVRFDPDELIFWRRSFRRSPDPVVPSVRPQTELQTR